MQTLGRIGEEPGAVGIGRGDIVQQVAVGMGVDGDPVGDRIGPVGKAHCLNLPGGGNAGRDLGRAFGRGGKCEIGGLHRGHIDMEIDPVEQGA